MKRLIKPIDRISTQVGEWISWCNVILVLLVSLDVFMRYIFNKSFVAIHELEWHLFALIFLSGAAYTLKENSHVRVDVFYARLSKRGKAFINVLGCLLFLFPGCYLVIKTSIPFVHSSWSVMEGSPDPGGLHARYLLKAVIPFGFALLALQGVSFFIKNFLIFKNPEKYDFKSFRNNNDKS